MSYPRIITSVLLMGLLSGPALLVGAPPQAFELKRAPVEVGDGWSVRMSTRVEQDPVALGKEASDDDYVETSAAYRCRILDRNPKGEVQLETRFGQQTVDMLTDGEKTSESTPAKTLVEWGQAEELIAPTEVGPCSLLDRETVKVGDRWTTEGTLVVGGVAPVTLRVVYSVSGTVERNGERLLRITTRGKGSTPAEGGATISVSTQGVIFVNPECADRPRRVALVYRFKISGGEGPDVATRTTLRLETKRLKTP